MSDLVLIALARGIHVLAGTAWAGSLLVTAAIVVPLATQFRAEGAGRWSGLVAMRAGKFAGIAAMLTVLSGIYLFAMLHAHDDTASGLVLKAGAVAALLSMVLGIVVNRPVGMALARLEAQAEPDAARLAVLRARATLSSRVVVALLVVAIVAMGVFRYAAALA